jgi:hypothetical protein
MYLCLTPDSTLAEPVRTPEIQECALQILGQSPPTFVMSHESSLCGEILHSALVQEQQKGKRREKTVIANR